VISGVYGSLSHIDSSHVAALRETMVEHSVDIGYGKPGVLFSEVLIKRRSGLDTTKDLSRGKEEPARLDDSICIWSWSANIKGCISSFTLHDQGFVWMRLGAK
jgi:hypothetical protein